jgi:hypothetical protein
MQQPHGPHSLPNQPIHMALALIHHQSLFVIRQSNRKPFHP